MEVEAHKRYLVFCFDSHYPGGGLNQVHISFDTIQEAREYESDHDYKEIYDRIKGVEVE